MAIAGGVGLEADLDALVELRGCSGETALFGEGPGGFVLAGDPAELEAAGGRGVDLFALGRQAASGSRSRPPRPRSTSRSPTPTRAWRSLAEQLEAPAALV